MEFKQQQAIYLQIADYICDKVLSREWIIDSKIPSIRELAIEVEVNPNTVAKAYDYLEAQHIIYTQRGIGYFVAKNADKVILSNKKDRFFNEDLSALFKTMQLLQIDIEDIKNLHRKFNQQQTLRNKS